MRFLFLLSLLTISACNARLYLDQDPAATGTTLAVGESAYFRFFTAEPAVESGIRIVSGGNYRLKIDKLSNWIDGDIDRNENGGLIDETGFADSLMPLNQMALLKRSRNHRWFELMLYLDECARESLKGVSDLSYDAADQAYTFSASCNGDLNLFVNDSQGFYINNVGFATLVVSRVN